MASRRSPSPYSSRNSEGNLNPRKSFSGNPFTTTTDHMKRNSINRQSTGSIGSMFQDGKENQKDANPSPARIASRNFMAPTISAAKKFTPSPRKKILSEKNDAKPSSIRVLDKDLEFKPRAEQKVIVLEKGSVQEVSLSTTSDLADRLTETLGDITDVTDDSDSVKIRQCFGPKGLPAVAPFDSSATNDLTETLCDITDVTDDSDSVKIGQCFAPKRLPVVAPFDPSATNDVSETLSDVTVESELVKMRSCLPPKASTIVAAAPPESDPNLPPYDAKNNFLSPRPRFLRYKPNPRIESILNKDENDDFGGDDGINLEDSFNLSDDSSENEVEEQEPEKEKEGASGDDSVRGSSEDSVRGSSDGLSEMRVEENPVDLKVGRESKPKPRFFTGSKMIWFIFVLFIGACVSVSLTTSPPMDLPIYEDVDFAEIYRESLRIAKFAKESFDDLVENVKQWSIQKLLKNHKIGSLQYFNLTSYPLPEELLFNIEEVQEFEEETEWMEEVEEYDDDDLEEMEVDDDDLEDLEVNEVVTEEEPIDKKIQTVVDDHVETELNLDDGSASVTETKTEVTGEEAQSEMVGNEYKADLGIADCNAESEALGSVLSKSFGTVCVSCFSMLLVAALAAFYMYRKKSKCATIGESCSSLSTNVEKGYKKKGSNRRESSASSASEFSMDSSSFGSFTTLERISVKRKDEVMLTPIRRSSRLLKNRVVS